MVHRKVRRFVRKVFRRPTPTSARTQSTTPQVQRQQSLPPQGPSLTGGSSRPAPRPTSRPSRRGGGQSRPSGPTQVTPRGKAVGTARLPTPKRAGIGKTIQERRILRRKEKARIQKRRLAITQLPRKDIITPLERVRIIKRERAAKFKRKFIPTFDKEVGRARQERVKSFFKRQTGFDLYEKEANKSGDKIFNQVSNFADSRLNFYQGQVNAGKISVGEADKRIKQDIDKKQNELTNKNEFFREKNPRKPTTSAVAFNLETSRLKASKEGKTGQANALLFLRIVADTPHSIVKLGIDAKKGVTKLFNDPQTREDSITKIKETFSIEKAKALPKKIEVKATELKNFVQTSPTTALAVVGGTLVSFAIGGAFIKGGKATLKLTGIVSKGVSKKVIPSLKLDPFVKQGLKDVGKISIEISPKILARVSKATRTGRPLQVSTEATRRLVKSFNQTIKKSKLGTGAKKISVGSLRLRKKLSRQAMRHRKRVLKRRISKIKFVRGIRIKVKKVSVAKERLIIKKRRKKRREEKEKRRAVLKRKAKEEAKEKRFKASELGRGVAKVRKIPKKIKRKVVESRRGVAARKLSRRLKERKVRIVQRKRLTKRRKEKIKKRRVLIKQEKFRTSRIGRLKVSVSKKIKKLDKIIKKFETPSAKLVFPRAKTPFRKTFPRQFKLKINDVAVERFVRKQVKLRGFNFNKLSGIEKNFLIGQVKARIRNQPSKFIPKERRLALKRFKAKQPRKIKKIARKEIRIQIKSGGEITITKIKPTKTSRRTPLSKTFPREPRGGRQILLQKPKLKKPRQIISETQIVPAQLNKAQKLALQKLRKIQGKQRLVQKEINVLKGKQRLKPRQKTRQSIKSKLRNLQRLASRSLIAFGQVSRQGITPRLAQPPILAQPLASPQAIAQAQKIAQPPRVGLKPIQKVPPRAPAKSLPFGFTGKRTRPKKKPTKQPAYNVFGRPLKRFKGQKQPKLIKLNKRPLSKVQAERLGSTLADTTISRTFKIKAIKGKPKKPTLKTQSFKKRKFRSFRIKKGKRIGLKNTFIEKRKFLIDTRGEKRGLTLRRGLARLRKKSKVKPTKKKVVKKVTIPNQRSKLLKNLKKARAVRMENLRRR